MDPMQIRIRNTASLGEILHFCLLQILKQTENELIIDVDETVSDESGVGEEAAQMVIWSRPGDLPAAADDAVGPADDLHPAKDRPAAEDGDVMNEEPEFLLVLGDSEYNRFKVSKIN